jgi:hypothetical protein
LFWHKDADANGVYYCFDTTGDDLEYAVMMDGHGIQWAGPSPLAKEEAVSQWVAGFFAWNDAAKGAEPVYRLRYALIG